jgi:hypothetical protein
MSASCVAADFFQLLLACLQWRVFYIEHTKGRDYAGGSNEDVMVEMERNPTHIPVDDFLSCKE